MPIVANGKSNEVVSLFTSSNGRVSWYSLRLSVELVSGANCAVEIKVNGDSIPDQVGAFVCSVGGGLQRRIASMFVELDDGDVVTADVQGPGTINLSLSGDVASEQL
jgi:hypothetical protein